LRKSRIITAASLIAAVISGTVVVGVASAAPAVHRTPAAVNYVALGDSYSAGVGAGNYISSSGSCDRSTSAYPQLWADASKPASFTFAACSGATTLSVISDQLSALSASTTLVSVTAGGDDAGFTSVMETCVLESQNSCLSAVSTAEAFVASQLPARLDTMLADIRRHAPSATVVVLGYPDLYDLSHSGLCIGLSGADRSALNQGAGDLDTALATAAQVSHDEFADVRPQFAGHEICDSASWLHSVDIFAISSSYHPTAAGQQDGYLPVFGRAAG
jgi:lysophospholipase L1-like esterase